MPVLSWIGHHRLWSLGGGLVILAAMALAGLWFFILRSPGTQIELRQALVQYRQRQTDGSRAISALLPAPGVYRFRTSGYEQLSIGGIGRTFPANTLMVVTDSRCATVEWEPFDQHREEMMLCPSRDASLSMTSAVTFEQIAGLQTTNRITCGPGAYVVPPMAVGHRWRATCSAPGGTVTLEGLLVGTTSVAVGGRRVPAVHTRVTLGFDGAQTGTNPTDYWVAVNGGAILREEESVDVTQQAGALGSVRFTEQMAITLASASPAH